MTSYACILCREVPNGLLNAHKICRKHKYLTDYGPCQTSSCKCMKIVPHQYELRMPATTGIRGKTAQIKRLWLCDEHENDYVHVSKSKEPINMRTDGLMFEKTVS